MESKNSFSNLSNSFELVWTVTKVSMSALSEEVLSSPVISLHFLDTKWKFHLQFINCKFEVRLERCPDSGPQTVYIDMVTLAHDYFQAVNHNSKYAFKQGDIYPLFQFRKCFNPCEENFVVDPSKDELQICCTIFPDSIIYFEYLLLSGDMQYNNLLTAYFSEFTDAFFCTPNMEDTSYHFSISHSRVSEVRLQRNIRQGSAILHIDDPNFDTNDFDLRKFIYSGQVDFKTREYFREVRLTDSPFCTFGIEKKFRGVPQKYTVKTDITTRRKFFRLIFNGKSTKLDNRVRTFITFGIQWRLEISFSKLRSEKYAFRMMLLRRVSPFPKLVVRYLTYVRCVCSYRKLGNSVEIDNWTHKREFNQKIVICKNAIPHCCEKRYFDIHLAVWSGKNKFTFKAEDPKTFVHDPLPDILSFSTYMLKLFESSMSYDTDIKMPDGNIRAHRDILSARSPVFKNMFHSHMMEVSEHIVNICDFQKSVMYKLIKYMYCAEVEFETTEEVIQLAYAADKYEVMLLKYKCLLYLDNNMNYDNAIEIFITCHFLEEEDFKSNVKSYMQANESMFSKQQLDDFRLTWPDLYFEVFLQHLL